MSFFQRRGLRTYSLIRLAALSLFVLFASLNEAMSAEVASSTISEIGSSGRANEFDGLEYARYIYQRHKKSPDYSQKYVINCHLLAYKENLFGVTGYAYSTFKVNHCNPDSFVKLSAASAKAQLRSVVDFDYLLLTGPHIQMMDRNLTPVENSYISIGSLNFTQMGTFKVKFWSMLQHKLHARKGLAYTPVNIHEDVYYVWYPNSVIYKIITDDGRVFILTNLSTQSTIGSDSDIELFARNVGEQINLPKGWVYKVEPVHKIFVVRNISATSEMTTRMMDDFGNYYIEINPGHIKG